MLFSDYSYRFDEVKEGYQGPLYVEILPLSFAVRVRQGLALNQLRLMVGRTSLGDEALRHLHGEQPALYVDGQVVAEPELTLMAASSSAST